VRVGGVVQRASCRALHTLQKAMQHFGAAPSTLEVKGGQSYLHLLLLASLVAAEARVLSEPGAYSAQALQSTHKTLQALNLCSNHHTHPGGDAQIFLGGDVVEACTAEVPSHIHPPAQRALGRPAMVTAAAASTTAAASTPPPPSGAHENMIKHSCTTSTLPDHLGKHAKRVLHQGSGTELSTRFATTGGEEQRRGERRPLAGPYAFDLLVLQMVSSTDGHSNPTRATASHRALSAAESDHDLTRRPSALPTVHRPPASPEALPSPTSLQAHLGPELCHLIAWKQHVPTASTA